MLPQAWAVIMPRAWPRPVREVIVHNPPPHKKVGGCSAHGNAATRRVGLARIRKLSKDAPRPDQAASQPGL